MNEDPTHPAPSAMEATPFCDSHSYYTKAPVETVDGNVHDFMRTDDAKKLERELTACKAALAKEEASHSCTKVLLANAASAIKMGVEQLETSRANEQKLASEVDQLKETYSRELALAEDATTKERVVRRELERVTRENIISARVIEAENKQCGQIYQIGLDSSFIIKRSTDALAASRALDGEDDQVITPSTSDVPLSGKWPAGDYEFCFTDLDGNHFSVCVGLMRPFSKYRIRRAR